jgi:hypothetical protein
MDGGGGPAESFQDAQWDSVIAKGFTLASLFVKQSEAGETVYLNLP